MSLGRDAPVDPQLASLDAAGTVELCNSLADYGEAGGLSPELMLRVGRFAEHRYDGNVDVLVAVGRMYLLGGEPARAKVALLRAGRIGPREPSLRRLLGDVLRELGESQSVDDALREARTAKLDPPSPPSSIPPPPAPLRPEQIPTEVKKRSAPRKEAPSDAPAARAPEMPAPRSLRIKLLDPDDERRRLDPYELVGELASGGMATVFLGRLAGAGGFERFVAIKLLHPNLASDEQFIDMFLDEARLAARIHNPHVVPILEVLESPKGYASVMEYVEGDTLAGLMARASRRGGAMPRPVAVRIILDALAGLHAAHEVKGADGQPLGLVHRDCTPQNILVGIDGSARITDFGVARAAARIAITRPQMVKGKVAYLSPEQAYAHELDRRSDLFTMGIVLWEALAGRPLFQAETEPATLSRLLSAPIPTVRSLVPDTPPALDEVCRRALTRDRSKRFASAADMADALERAAESRGDEEIASPREVAQFVDELIGAEIALQREAVRTWLSSHTSVDMTPMSRRAVLSSRPSIPPPLPTASLPAMPVPPRVPSIPPLLPTASVPPAPSPEPGEVEVAPATKPSERPPPPAKNAESAPAKPAEEPAKRALPAILASRWKLVALALIALALAGGVSSPLWLHKVKRFIWLHRPDRPHPPSSLGKPGRGPRPGATAPAPKPAPTPPPDDDLGPDVLGQPSATATGTAAPPP